jgi:hypothetical protein
MNAGMRQSGVYYLQIRGTTYWFLKVFCEQEIADGGWTVSLSRHQTREADAGCRRRALSSARKKIETNLGVNRHYELLILSRSFPVMNGS